MQYPVSMSHATEIEQPSPRIWRLYALAFTFLAVSGVFVVARSESFAEGFTYALTAAVIGAVAAICARRSSDG